MSDVGDIKTNVMKYLQKNQESPDPDNPDLESGAPSSTISCSSTPVIQDSANMPVGEVLK